MSSDGPPPLPASDDPWALLEVSRDADEKELKRAYARRIKVYRPDRSPEAFARIHAAYEQLQSWARYRAHLSDAEDAEDVPEPEPEATAEPTPAAAAPPERTTSRTAVSSVVADLTAHLDGGDLAAAERRWTESGLDLASVFEAAPGYVRDWLVGRAPVSWKVVSAWDHPHTATQVWLAALRVRVNDETRRREVEAMLDEPALLADVDHDEAAASVALRAASALAWHGGAGRRLFGRLGSIPRHPILEAMRDRAQLDLDLGDTVRALPPSNPLVIPPQLRRFLVDAPLLDGEELARVESELYDALDDDLDGWKAWIDGIYRTHYVFASALTERLLDSVPLHRRLLGALMRRPRRALAERLSAAKPPVPVWIVAVVVGIVVALAGVELLEDEAVGDAAIWVAIGLGVGGYYLERAIYRRRVRGPLLRILVDIGVTRAAAHEWIGSFMSRVPRLYPYRFHMSRDGGMRILAFVAASTHPGDRRSPDEHDEDADDDVVDPDEDYDDALIKEEDPDAPRGPLRRFFDWFNNLPFVR